MQVQLANRSVWFVTADTAIEEGVARVTRAGEVATETAYQTVFVRQGNAWKVDSIRERELPVTVPPSERLKALDWLFGEWGGENSKAKATFEWARNKNYIKAIFKIDEQDIVDAGEGQVANSDWLPLGVFAIVNQGETKPEKILQLAVNKDGAIRGNYYDKTWNENQPVQGSVDRQSQRAAWTVGSQNSMVYETGISNLTQDEVPVLLHCGNTAPSNLTMVRLKQPQSQGAGNP